MRPIALDRNLTGVGVYCESYLERTRRSPTPTRASSFATVRTGFFAHFRHAIEPNCPPPLCDHDLARQPTCFTA